MPAGQVCPAPHERLQYAKHTSGAEPSSGGSGQSFVSKHAGAQNLTRSWPMLVMQSPAPAQQSAEDSQGP